MPYMKHIHITVLAVMQLVVDPQNVCSSVDHKWTDYDFAFLACLNLFTSKKLKNKV